MRWQVNADDGRISFAPRNGNGSQKGWNPLDLILVVLGVVLVV